MIILDCLVHIQPIRVDFWLNFQNMTRIQTGHHLPATLLFQSHHLLQDLCNRFSPALFSSTFVLPQSIQIQQPKSIFTPKSAQVSPPLRSHQWLAIALREKARAFQWPWGPAWSLWMWSYNSLIQEKNGERKYPDLQMSIYVNATYIISIAWRISP